MQIVVLGFHRSGTSTVTRLINMMGCYCFAENKSAGFNEENPKGFWERLDVIKLNDAILANQNASWANIAGYDSLLALPIHNNPLESIEYKLKNIILDLDAHRPWVMKDPRLCLTFGHWRPHLEVPVCVIVHRDPYEIAISLKTRNNFAISHSLSLWEVYCTNLLNSTLNMKKIFINYQDLIQDPVGQMKYLYEALSKNNVQNIRLPQNEEVLAFVNQDLYRSKAEKEYSLEDILNVKQMKLIKYMTAQIEAKELITPSIASLLNLDTCKNHLHELSILERKIEDLQVQHNTCVNQLENNIKNLNSALRDSELQIAKQIQSYNKNITNKVIRKLLFQSEYLSLIHSLEYVKSTIKTPNIEENKLCLATN